MELDREWFGIFLGMLSDCLMPGLAALPALFSYSGFRERRSWFQWYPKGFEEIFAALVRLVSYVFLFALVYLVVPMFVYNSGRYTGSIVVPLFVFVLLGYGVLLLTTVLFWNRNPSLASKAAYLGIIGFLLFFVIPATL